MERACSHADSSGMKLAALSVVTASLLYVGAAHAQEAAPAPESPSYGRFGPFIGGLAVPSTVTAYAGGLFVNFNAPERGWQTRLGFVYAHVEDDHTATNDFAALLHGTYWFGGVYGLGFGSGLGYAKFDKKKSGGWDDDSMQVLAYFAPVQLRFGRKPTFELGLNAGATRFFAHDVRPFGYAYGSVLF